MTAWWLLPGSIVAALVVKALRAKYRWRCMFCGTPLNEHGRHC